MNTKIDPSESRISYGGHVCNGLEQNEQTLYLLPTKFISFGEAVLEEKICSDIDQSDNNCLWQPCLLMDQN
jgi:hypothetical protein